LAQRSHINAPFHEPPGWGSRVCFRLRKEETAGLRNLFPRCTQDIGDRTYRSETHSRHQPTGIWARGAKQIGRGNQRSRPCEWKGDKAGTRGKGREL